MGVYKFNYPQSNSDFIKLYQRIVRLRQKGVRLTAEQKRHALEVIEALQDYVRSCTGVVDTFNLNRSIESANKSPECVTKVPDLDIGRESGNLTTSKTLRVLKEWFESIEPIQLAFKPKKQKPDPVLRQPPGKKGCGKGKDSSRHKAADMILSQ